MPIGTYFDVSWEGPVLDSAGKPTGQQKGKNANHYECWLTEGDR